MRFTAQSNESPTVNSAAVPPRSASFGSEAGAAALAATTEETVHLALAPSAEAKAGRENGQDSTTVTPNSLVDRAGNHAGAARTLSFPPRLPPPRPSATLHALQEWEGYVVEMDDHEFVVRLVDLTAGSTHEEEEAVIPLAEISERDAATVRVGSIFRWVIGYERSPFGTKKRVSQIVFRDLPRMTERDFGEGRRWARETMRAFGR